MPSKSPSIAEHQLAWLVELGRAIREQRQRHGITAVSAAEAAGMSRVTLHRIERGEPSVTMGAYLSAIDAVGLALSLAGQGALDTPEAGTPDAGSVPAAIRVSDYPELRRLTWQMGADEVLTPAEALSVYERNWRHVDVEAMPPGERALLRALEEHVAGGRLLVPA